MNTREITAAIKKELPKEVGKVLQEELAALKRIREDYKEKCDECNIIIEQRDRANEQVNKFAEQVSMHQDLAQRERCCKVLEIELEHQRRMLEQCDIATANRLSDMKELVSLVFQNNHYKHERVKRVPDESGYVSPLGDGTVVKEVTESDSIG